MAITSLGSLGIFPRTRKTPFLLTNCLRNQLKEVSSDKNSSIYQFFRAKEMLLPELQTKMHGSL
jgi:hypothetical protein